MVGTIRLPPKNIVYYPPKGSGRKKAGEALIIARAMIKEYTEVGVYYRFVDRLKWLPSSKVSNRAHEELRFAYFYCNPKDAKKCNNKPKKYDKVWIFGQGAGHMRPYTFAKLIKKAQTNPDYKHPDFDGFGKSLKRIKVRINS